MGLTLDVGFAGFLLGVEGVEGEIEIMLGRFGESFPSAKGCILTKFRLSFNAG
jgi:hypothetical protein